VHLLRSLGGLVWTIGTTRRAGDYQGTMMAAGLPDVIAAVRGRMLMLECKAKGGRPSEAQRVFQAACADCGVHHVVGGVDELLRWLVAEGLVKADAVPHYRMPGAGTAESPILAAQRRAGATQGAGPRSHYTETPSGALSGQHKEAGNG
jgi:hypothetical protein